MAPKRQFYFLDFKIEISVCLCVTSGTDDMMVHGKPSVEAKQDMKRQRGGPLHHIPNATRLNQPGGLGKSIGWCRIPWCSYVICKKWSTPDVKVTLCMMHEQIVSKVSTQNIIFSTNTHLYIVVQNIINL